MLFQRQVPSGDIPIRYIQIPVNSLIDTYLRHSKLCEMIRFYNKILQSYEDIKNIKETTKIKQNNTNKIKNTTGSKFLCESQ